MTRVERIRSDGSQGRTAVRPYQQIIPETTVVHLRIEEWKEEMGNMRNIVVVPYDPTWPDQFEEEATRLRAVFGDLLVEIHHIGSTSIPGIYAKPIIDMMPLVRDIEAVDALNPAMIELGYEPRGEYGIPGRRYFPKGGDEQRTHNVHTFAADNPEATRHLAFRDYMRAHPDEAQAYSRLKQEGARLYPHDIEGYMDHKDAFIKEAERKALAWWSGTIEPNR